MNDTAHSSGTPGSTDSPSAEPVVLTMQARRRARALFCFFLGLYGLSGGGRFFSVDEISVYQAARFFAPWDGRPIHKSIVTATNAQGQEWNVQGPTQSVLALPLLWLAQPAETLLPETWKKALLGPRWVEGRLVWSGELDIFMVSFFNAWVTAAWVAAFYVLVLLLGAPSGAAAIATLALGTTTLLFAHSENFFTHPIVGLGLLVAVIGLRLYRQGQRGGFWVAVLAASLAGLTRPTATLLWPWLVVLAGLWRPRGEGLTQAVRFALWLAPAAFFWLAYNSLRFGNPFTTGYARYGDFSTPLWVGVYGNLFSLSRSIFIFSPLLVAALFGWRRLAGREPALAAVLAGIAVSDLVAVSTWKGWHGGWAFGNRMLLHLVPVIALTLPWVWERARSAGAPLGRVARLGGLAALAAAGLVVQILGMSVYVSTAYYQAGIARAADPDAYLFTAAEHQLGGFWSTLWSDAPLDFWMHRVLTQAGPGAALVCALPGLTAIGAALWLWRRAATSDRALNPGAAPGTPPPAPSAPAH